MKTAARLPEFFAVGPPRTATTWLHRVLLGHVNLPEGVKETRFFDLRFSNGFDWYRRHFEHARPELPTGEIAPTYFYSAAARERIAALVPTARIIVTLRDPVERLFSLYKKKRTSGRVTGTFASVLRHDPEMMESSRYVFHLTEWLKALGNDRVLVVVYEDLLRDPTAYVRRLADHIGIPSYEIDPAVFGPENSADRAPIPRIPAWTRLGVVTAERLYAYGFARTMALAKRLRLRRLFLAASGATVPPLDRLVAANLRELFRTEVEALEALLGQDLSVWKTGADDEIPTISRQSLVASQIQTRGGSSPVASEIVL